MQLLDGWTSVCLGVTTLRPYIAIRIQSHLDLIQASLHTSRIKTFQ